MKGLLLTTAIILGLSAVSPQLAIGPTVAQTTSALAGEVSVLFGNSRSEAAPRFLSESGRDFSWQLSIASFPQTETQP